MRPARSFKLQIKALERRLPDNDLARALVTEVLRKQEASLDAAAAERAKVIERLVEDLTVWRWVEPIRGVGRLQLGQIIAEAGDLNNFANPAKLWRFFGLAVIDGQAERLHRGQQAAFNPRLKGMAFTLATGLRNHNHSEYRALYDEQKAKAIARGWDKQKSQTTNRAEAHAMRLLAKRFLRDLWRAWRVT